MYESERDSRSIKVYEKIITKHYCLIIKVFNVWQSTPYERRQNDGTDGDILSKPFISSIGAGCCRLVCLKWYTPCMQGFAWIFVSWISEKWVFIYQE